ncbi:MAG: extracellular solute-binding protein [Fimbriimonadaceae bacterium]|nr:extracellular solute-binding protein [Fimbriimonadaceae bacterium]
MTKSLGIFLLLIWAAATSATTVRFWAVTGSADDAAMYRRLAAAYEKRTGVHVEVTPLAWGNFQSKYFTAMAAGMPPDVGATNLGGPFDYGTVGGLVDLRQEFPAECRDLERRFNPRLMPLFSVGDHLYGVPADLSTVVLVYRKDIFARLGLAAPQTWSQLERTIMALEGAGYRTYFNFTAGAQWALYMYTMPYGVQGVEQRPDGSGKLNWREPAYQKGVMQALKFWSLRDSPGKDLGSRFTGLFRSDKPGEAVPLLIDLPQVNGMKQLAPEVADKIGVAPWPKADDGQPYSVVGGITYVVFRKGKEHKAAFDWLKYLCSDEGQQAVVLDRMSRKTGGELTISALKDMYGPQAESFWAQPAFDPVRDMQKVIAAAYPSFGTTASVQGNTEAGRIEQNLLDEMQSYIVDQVSKEAEKLGLTRSTLHRAWGQGRHLDVREAIVQRATQELKRKYDVAAPKAEQQLQEAAARQARRTQTVLRDLDKYEKAPNIMDGIKGGLLAASVGLTALVLLHPRLRKYRLSYLYVAVPLALAVVFVFVPALTALYISFTEYHPVLPLSTAMPVGLRNYTDIFRSGEMQAALSRTLVYAVGTVPLGLVLSLGCALLLNSVKRGTNFWRFIYFSPMVTSGVSIALIFAQLFMFGKEGWLNALLLNLHLVREPVQFLQSEHNFLNSVMALAVWQGIAFSTIVFLAGLQQIPDQLFEAAEIDGAGAGDKLRHVVLPGVRPQTAFLSILGVIGGFQVFDTIFLLAGKSGDAGARFGPNDSGMTVVPLIYHLGFENMQMGVSSAAAYVLFAVVLLLTFVQWRFFSAPGRQS